MIVYYRCEFITYFSYIAMMKRTTFILGISLLFFACKKRNITSEEVKYTGIDALRNYDWKLVQHFWLDNYRSSKDTVDYMEYMDSCMRNTTYRLSDTMVFGNMYYFVDTDPCSGGVNSYGQIMGFDTVDNLVYVAYGWYTVNYLLEALDDEYFRFYLPNDSSRIYYVYRRVQ